jgi:acyl carrier protein
MSHLLTQSQQILGKTLAHHGHLKLPSDILKIDPATTFKELGVDSLDLIDLVTSIEESEFDGREFDEEVWNKVRTVQQALDAIDSAITEYLQR